MDDDSSRSSYNSFRPTHSSHKRQYDSDSDSSRGYMSKSFSHKQPSDLAHYDDVDEQDSNAEFRQSSKHDQKKNRGQKRQVFSDSDDESKDEDKPIYCICRSSDMNRFMIGCDNCEEWFHGDCVHVTSAYSKKIEKYYCDACRTKDPSLVTMLKEPYASRERAKKEKAARAAEISHFKAVEKENNLPFDIRFKPHTRMDSEEERDNYLPEDDDDYDEDDVEFRLERGESSSKRPSLNKKGRPKKSEKESKSKSKQRGRKKGQSNKTKNNKGRGKKNDSKKSQKEHHRRGKHKTQSDDELDELKSKIPRHCFGPKCIKSARKGSKYCSDECGIRLAKDRLMGILPQRIADWHKIPCAADELSQKTHKEINFEFEQIKTNLADIELKQAEFDAILDQGKSCIPFSEEESEEILENEPDTDYQVFCYCCTTEVSMKGVCTLKFIHFKLFNFQFLYQFLKHMERCFNKIESASTYVSSIEPQSLLAVINREVFCNFYHPKQGIYCRRYVNTDCILVFLY